MSEKTKLNGPSNSEVGSMTYRNECMFALEPSINKLITIATGAGWARDQALYAIMGIAAREVTDN